MNRRLMHPDELLKPPKGGERVKGCTPQTRGCKMGHDAYIEFEESNYEDLVEKFIDANRSKWEEFVMYEYEAHTPDGPEPDYDTLEEKKLDEIL